MNFPFIYLASASPRRHELLLQMGVDHEVLDVPTPPGEDEPRLPDEVPRAYVRRTARDKALRARDWLSKVGHPSKSKASLMPCSPVPILSADTAVVLGQDVLGKPRDLEEARHILARLSGRNHVVHTAIVLAHGMDLFEDVSITEVRFKPLSQQEISDYCATGEPFGKAGAYGIQGRAGAFVEHISGSYTGVMGLPVFETSRLLHALTGTSPTN